jgi:hypothetical protein
MVQQMDIDFEKNIYHFTTSDKALLYILPKLRLRISSIINTNDPQENKFFNNWEIFNNQNPLVAIKAQKSLKLYTEKFCKVICFSTDYYNNNTPVFGYNHPTMWAHYGDYYKGICLVIDKKQFIENYEKNNNYKFDKVNYTPSVFFPKFDVLKWEQKQDEYFKDYLLTNSKSLFFTKHYHWQPEDEFRLIHIGNDEFCSIENSLIGVYYGYDFNEELVNLLNRLIPKNKFIAKMSWKDGRLFPIPETFINRGY